MAVLKTQFTMRLDLIDHAKIRKIAWEENRSMTTLLKVLVRREIRRYEQEHGEISVTDEDLMLK
ncbi:MAG: hypothetical protein QM689_00060 [Oscillospiraceae bacterium]